MKQLTREQLNAHAKIFLEEVLSEVENNPNYGNMPLNKNVEKLGYVIQHLSNLVENDSKQLSFDFGDA